MYLHSHTQKHIPGVYLHVCKLYMHVNLVHANWTLEFAEHITCRNAIRKFDVIFHDNNVVRIHIVNASYLT